MEIRPSQMRRNRGAQVRPFVSKLTGLCTVPLASTDKVAVCDADRLGVVGILKWFYTKDGYARTTAWIDGRRKTIGMHRLFMLLDGAISNDAGISIQVDHVNGDALDNRRANLRACLASQNQANRTRLNRTNTSGHHGVRFDKTRGKWRAVITFQKRTRYIGYFQNIHDAIAARKRVAAELRGEFVSAIDSPPAIAPAEAKLAEKERP